MSINLLSFNINMGIKNEEFEAYFDSAKNCKVIHAKKLPTKK